MWVSSCRNNSSHITNHQSPAQPDRNCQFARLWHLASDHSQPIGYDGFLQHTRAVLEFYRQKRDVFEKVLHAEWSSPEAGMFVWYVNIDSLTLTD